MAHGSIFQLRLFVPRPLGSCRKHIRFLVPYRVKNYPMVRAHHIRFKRPIRRAALSTGAESPRIRHHPDPGPFRGRPAWHQLARPQFHGHHEQSVYRRNLMIKFNQQLPNGDRKLVRTIGFRPHSIAHTSKHNAEFPTGSLH